MNGTQPERDEDAFLQALATGVVLVQRCEDCEAHRFPPMPYCSFCGSGSATEVRLSGLATLYSWIVIHRTVDPVFREQTPYVVGTVDIAVPYGLVRLPARIEVDDPDTLAHDEPLELVTPDEGTPDLRFRPVAA